VGDGGSVFAGIELVSEGIEWERVISEVRNVKDGFSEGEIESC
jgi:hypothetical protein